MGKPRFLKRSVYKGHKRIPYALRRVAGLYTKDDVDALKRTYLERYGEAEFDRYLSLPVLRRALRGAPVNRLVYARVMYTLTTFEGTRDKQETNQ